MALTSKFVNSFFVSEAKDIPSPPILQQSEPICNLYAITTLHIAFWFQLISKLYKIFATFFGS